MKTHKFARKPFYVDAIRVSEDNLVEVATWCQGEVLTDEEGKHIKVRVHRPLTDRQTKAYVGDWVLYAGTGYKVYTQKSFDKSFEKVKTLTKAQADEAGIKVPHEKRPRNERKPQNPVLSKEMAEKIANAPVSSTSVVVDPEAVFSVPQIKEPIDEAEALIQEVLRGN